MGQSKHDRIIDNVVERLWSSGFYDKIETCQEYGKSSRVIGEVDILAHTKKGYIHFYEIKSTHKHKALSKARNQYRRYQNHFYSDKLKGIYVTPQLVMRL